MWDLVGFVVLFLMVVLVKTHNATGTVPDFFCIFVAAAIIVPLIALS